MKGLRRADRKISTASSNHSEAPFYMTMDIPCDLMHYIEVAEHIDEDYQLHPVASLCNALVIVMTPAVPSHRGQHRVNTKTKEFWVGKLGERGYERQIYNDRFRRLASQTTRTIFPKFGLIFLGRI